MKPDIQEITELIRQRTGLVLCAPQPEHLAERIQERLGTLRLHDGGAYAALLRSQTAVSQQEWRSLLTLLTVGESYFFRDQGQFRLLRQRLLPALLERCRATRTLRIWSAGCSTGEELHSLAILLRELLSSEAAAWDVELLGT
ncbi:MAG: CheR family methyltransferase, partial [Terriglobales bacterium]